MDPVVVTVKESHRGEIADIAQELSSRGMHIHDVQELVGTISGSAASNAWKSLREIPGVASVDAQQDIALPPSDSDVQ
jgi:hypothetical protein